MKDERLALKCFMQILKPCLGDWKELGEIHEDILDALLCHDPNVCLLASRNSAKSTLTYQYATWRLWRNPEREIILIVSNAENLAKRAIKQIRDYISLHPLLEELQPDADQHDAAFQLEVGPAKGKLGMSTSLTAKGLSGQLPGLRATLVIGDDVEVPAHETPEQVDRLEESMGEFQNIGSAGAEIKVLGTPQSEFSLYGRLNRSEAWTMFRAPMFSSDTIDGKEIFFSRWPSRWSPDEIEKKRKALTKRLFALHWRIDLSETKQDERPWELKDLPVITLSSLSQKVPVVMTGGGDVIYGLPKGLTDDTDDWRGTSFISPDTCGYTMTVAAVDPSSGLRGRDAIGLSIVSVTGGGQAVIRFSSGIRGETQAEAMTVLAETIAKFKTNRLLIEENEAGLFGQVLQPLLTNRGYPLTFEKVKTGGMTKGRRIIQALSPALASGRLFICKDVLIHDDAADFVNQFTGIRESKSATKLKHDDIIDSLSYAVADLGSLFGTDQSELAAGVRVNYDQMKRLGPRHCVLNEEELEWWCEADENMQMVQGQLQQAITLQMEESTRGFNDPILASRIDHLQTELAKYERGSNSYRLTTLNGYLNNA